MATKARGLKAFEEGQEAVRRKPYHAPENPYDCDEQPDLHEQWEDGAASAGLNDIYTNGVLNREEQR